MLLTPIPHAVTHRLSNEKLLLLEINLTVALGIKRTKLYAAYRSSLIW